MQVFVWTGACPENFVDDGTGEICYMFFDNDAFTAQDAQTTCQDYKSNLPVFKTRTEIDNYNKLAYFMCNIFIHESQYFFCLEWV